MGGPMNSQQRREYFRQHLKSVLAQENPFLRHITFRYPPTESEWGQFPTEITVNGQHPGILELRGKTTAATPEVQVRFRAKGFSFSPDEDDPSYSVFSAVADKAGADEVADFVEWAFLVALDSPDDYDPLIRTPVSEQGPSGAPAKPGKGCSSGCRNIALALLWLLLAIFALRFLFGG